MNYCSKSEVVALIKEYRKSKAIPGRLVDILYQIAQGLQSRYQFKLDSEDIVQNAVVVCIERLDFIDIKQNPFSYLTTLCFNSFRGDCRRQRAFEKGVTKLAEKLRRNDQ